jgi:Tol biopolymer transport system component
LEVGPEFVLEGKIAFWSDRGGEEALWISSEGNPDPVRLTSGGGNVSPPLWSPDGSKIVYASSRTGNGEVYVVNTDGTGEVNVSNHPAPDGHPGWSPDGSKIVFASARDGDPEVFAMNADGSGVTQLTHTWGAISDNKPQWSPDGSRIAYYSNRGGSGEEISAMDPDGTNQVRLAAVDYAGYFDWSPDGSRIAFCDVGRGRLGMVNPDGTGHSDIVGPVPGCFEPIRWAPDGSQVTYNAWMTGTRSALCIIKPDGSGFRELTGGAGPWASWSPDSEWIVFDKEEEGEGERGIFVLHVATGAVTSLTPAGVNDRSPEWRGGG